MKIRIIIILFVVIAEIAPISSAIHTGKRRTRCCGGKLFQTIFKKMARRSLRRASSKLHNHTNIVKQRGKVDHSMSSWLSGSNPSIIYSVDNNIYFDPYESVLVNSSPLSGLMGSLDVSEHEYAKWGQGGDLFDEEDSNLPSYVTEKRKPKITSKYFRRMTQSYRQNDSYLRALEPSKLPSRKFKYPYGCYSYSKQFYQLECDDKKYEVPLVNHEFAGYDNEEPFSPEKIRTFKIFVNLEKGNRIPGISEIM